MTSPVVSEVTVTIDPDIDNSKVFNYPAEVNLDDGLIALYVHHESTSVAWGSDFLEIYDSGGNPVISASYRQADGTEDGGTFTAAPTPNRKACCALFRITGHEDFGTQAPESATPSTGTSTSPDPPSITPTGGPKDFLYIAHAGSNITENFSGFPSGYINTGDAENTAPDAASLGWASKETTNTSSENAGVFTIDSSQAWRCNAIAVHPAAAAAAIPPRNQSALQAVARMGHY